MATWTSTNTTARHFDTVEGRGVLGIVLVASAGKVLGGEVPVHHVVQERLDEVRATVLEVQVVSMLLQTTTFRFSFRPEIPLLPHS